MLVRPGRATWTEAHGRDVIVEHVADVRWSTLGGGAALRDLAQLHRPAAIACGWPGMPPGLLQLASARLVPRPALIGVHEGSASVVPWWAAQVLASFDAVFVDDLEAARRLRARGIDRIYHVPRGVDLDEYSPSRRTRPFIEELVVAVVIGPEVDAPVLRRIHAALRCSLPSEPAVVIVDRGVEPRARIARFAAGFASVHLPKCDDSSERARWLSACDVAVILPGSAAGLRSAEAMACGLPCVELADIQPEQIADAVVRLCRSELAVLGGRARSLVEQLRLDHCLARERLCVREVVEHVRAGERVPSGIHERLQPQRLTS